MATHEKDMGALAPSSTPTQAFGSRTHVGYVRSQNEDSIYADPPLFIVCDGMGGHEAGEIASEIAVNTISSRAPRKADAKGLAQAVREANLAIIRATKEGVGREGMGTTCTAAIVDGTKLVIAQAGDSRAYLLHNGSLQQITRDHSLVADLIDNGEITPEEARTHPWRSYITRALGLDPNMEPDLYEIETSESDRLLLCSDGLYSMVEDSLIREVLEDDHNPQVAADELVDEALAGGGADNVSVVIADIGPTDEKARMRVRKSKAWIIAIICIAIALIVGTFVAVGAWVGNSAYLSEVHGNVAIYKGLPNGLFGIQNSELVEVSDVPTDQLQPGVASRLREEGIPCATVDAARDLIGQYRLEIYERQLPPGNGSVTSGQVGEGDASDDMPSQSGEDADSAEAAPEQGAGQ